jgi:excisionase family DNA binding protein
MVPVPPSRGRLLPTSIVAQRLGRSVRTVRLYAASGRIPAVRVGSNLWKFYDFDVDRFRLQYCAHSDEAA